MTKNAGGVKIVTRYPDRNPALESQLILFDAESGETLALLDADWITAMRTGAVAAHSIATFAKKNSEVIGMMGLGNVARSTMLEIVELFPDKKWTVKLLKYKGQEESFVQRFANYENLNFVFVDTVEQMVDNSDIVISAATYLSDDICDDKFFKEGVLVIPIHTRGFTNCDLFFDKVFADDYNHVSHFKNFSRFRYFAEVSDVVNHNKSGRENDRERILVYNIGVSIHDVNFASHIYEKIDKTSLQEINLCQPSEKFWI